MFEGDVRTVEVDGYEVDLRNLTKALAEEQVAFILETYVNSFGLGGPATRIGERLSKIHNSLQRNVVVFCIGLLRGLSEGNDYTDARNATAIATAREIVRLHDLGKLHTGPAI